MEALMPALLVFFAVAVTVIFLALGMEALRGWREKKQLASRLESLDDELAGAGSAGHAAVLRARSEMPRVLQLVTERFPSIGDPTALLEQADVSWSARTFLLVTVGCSIVLGMASLAFAGRIDMAAGAALLGAAAPYMYLRHRRKRRMRKLEEQLPEGIDLMGRALRAGHPFPSGIKMVADEMPDPLGTEFGRVFEEQRFGLPVADAMLSMADRTTLLDVRIFVTAVLIQREVGGNLAEIMDNLAYVIRERFRIRGEIRTRSAQGRMTGYLLAALPILSGIAFLGINPDYIMTLFQDPLGHLFIGIALTLQIIGFFWIRKIVDIEI